MLDSRYRHGWNQSQWWAWSYSRLSNAGSRRLHTTGCWGYLVTFMMLFIYLRFPFASIYTPVSAESRKAHSTTRVFPASVRLQTPIPASDRTSEALELTASECWYLPTVMMWWPGKLQHIIERVCSAGSVGKWIRQMRSKSFFQSARTNKGKEYIATPNLQPSIKSTWAVCPPPIISPRLYPKKGNGVSNPGYEVYTAGA